ncbi:MULTISPECIES: hypothetical protein [Micromonospora]|uniref:hypothetical protein n=1 Tax=Micromonospora TaxID=1873 RepID=UPI0011B22F78|nr:hypothetical protein [Micromonospora sp. MH33]
MTRSLTPVALLKAAIATEAIPASAQIYRKGYASWSTPDFELTAVISGQPGGQLEWHLFVNDARLGPAMSDFGGMSVSVSSADGNAIPRNGVDINSEEAVSFLHNGIGAAKSFVRDRADLARLLASPTDVQRGELMAWLPAANYPARLVKALFVARDAELSELISEIDQKLKAGSILLPGGEELQIRPSARRWAREYAKRLGVEVPIG